MTPAELMEHLAAIEHERWADWQRWVHEAGTRNPDGSVTISAANVARWERQIATPYADLSEPEKEADRREVRRYWDLIAP
jgi:Tol biopolymer transport system component